MLDFSGIQLTLAVDFYILTFIYIYIYIILYIYDGILSDIYNGNTSLYYVILFCNFIQEF